MAADPGKALADYIDALIMEQLLYGYGFGVDGEPQRHRIATCMKDEAVVYGALRGMMFDADLEPTKARIRTLLEGVS